MPVTKGQGNPTWTFEETLLALDLIQRATPRVPGKTSPEVAEVSKTLAPGRLEARHGALADQVSLELGDGSQHVE